MQKLRSKRIDLSKLVALAIAGSAVLPAVSMAGTLYWDNNGTGAVQTATNPPTSGVGGSGTWDTTTADWFNATTHSYEAWTGTSSSAPDAADFRVTAGTITLGVGIYATQINIGSATAFTFNGQALNLIGSSPAFFITASGSLDVQSQIVTSTGLSQTSNSSGGTLTLDNSTNSITGDINVGTAGGILVLSDGSLGSTTNINIGANTTLGTVVFGIKASPTSDVSIAATRTITLASSTADWLMLSTGGTTGAAGRTLTINGQITGGGGILTTAGQAGSAGGTVVLANANNDYQGGTAVNRNTILKLASSGNLPTSTILYAFASASSTNDGGLVDLNGTSQTVTGLLSSPTASAANASGNTDTTAFSSGNAYGAITNTAASTTSTLTVAGTGSYLFHGILKDGGAGKVLALTLAKGGVTAPTLTLTNATTYSGATNINDGSTLALDFNQIATTSSTSPTNLINAASAVAFGGMGGTLSVIGRANGLAGSLTVVTGSTSTYQITVNSTAGLVAGEAIAGTGIPANDYVASIVDGTHLALSAAPSAAISNKTATVTATNFTTGQTLNSVAVNGNATLDVENNGGSGATLSVNSLRGSANINKTGDGTLIIYGTTSSNTWSGALTVTGGTATLGNSLALNSSSPNNVTINASAKLSTGGNSMAAGALTVAGSGTASIDLGSGASVFTFADSDAVAWSGAELDVLNWNGTFVSGGGTNQLFIGTDLTGLTTQQLSQVRFINPAGLLGSYSATQLNNGEVIAVAPEPASWSTILSCAAAVASLRRRRRADGIRILPVS